MWNCDVPNICVLLLCFGWYLMGIRVGKEVGKEDKESEEKNEM